LDETSLKRGAETKKRIFPSTGQMILEITKPGPVVQITLTDETTKNSVSAIIQVPMPEPSEKELEN